jgi:hypothetical protein
MKHTNFKISGTLLLALLFVNTNTNAQVGIGTETPDPSALLDVDSTTKGLLMPRLSTVQRDAILLPATGLVIYNLTLNDGQINIGIPSAPDWVGIKGNEEPMIDSVAEDGNITTRSTSSLLVPGMTLTPPSGTYIILFNAQMYNEVVTTEEAVNDLSLLYDDLMSIPVTDSSHGSVFGNGETLSPGVYDVAGASSIAGTLTMDGGGDPNSMFLIRFSGALSTGDSTIVTLTNGASSNNIFWVAEGAISLAASTIMKGTLVANNAAISMAADSILEGRMFSTTGAATVGPGTLNTPSGVSYFDLGILSTFVIFSSNGAISNTGNSIINGHVGTDTGAVSGFEGINGNVYGAGNETFSSEVTYSIYQDGLEVVNSSRTTNKYSAIVSLQAMVTVTAGDPLEIRWKVDIGEAKLNHRILSLIRSGD